MRSFLLVLIIGTMVPWGNLYAATGVAGTISVSCNGANGGGDPDPWPWGEELSFPWLSIKGVWVMEEDCLEKAYVFKPKAYSKFNPKNPFQRVIQITQYDPLTCHVTAKGIGYELDRVVRATMVSQKDGSAFDLTLRSFFSLEGALPKPKIGNTKLVLTISSKGQSDKRKVFPMQKIDEQTKMICYDNAFVRN